MTSSRPFRSRYRSGAKAFRYAIEALEPRVLLSTYTVINHLDSGPGSLRDAIAQANANAGPDSIMFAAQGTITLTSGQLEITDGLTITGPGASSLTISGDNSSRIFRVDAGVTASITGLTLTGGNSVGSGDPTGGPGGGAVDNLGTLVISNSSISANTAAAGGGVSNQGALTISNSDVSNNKVGYDGGGIYNAAGSLNVISSTIDGNSAGRGGGISAAVGLVEVTSSTISNNTSLSGGGCHY